MKPEYFNSIVNTDIEVKQECRVNESCINAPEMCDHMHNGCKQADEVKDPLYICGDLSIIKKETADCAESSEQFNYNEEPVEIKDIVKIEPVALIESYRDGIESNEISQDGNRVVETFINYQEGVEGNSQQLSIFECTSTETRGDSKDPIDYILIYSVENLFKCILCEFQCTEKDILESHIKSPTHKMLLNQRKKSNGAGINYKCSFCGYKCPQKFCFERHIRIHTKEKPFLCHLCEYRCAQKAGLDDHIKTHTGEKPFKCSFCDYKCSQRSNLKVHVKTHTGEKNFECSLCDYKCARKGSLKVHMKTHSDEKPFKCSLCKYKCAWKVCLKEHMKTHTGEKPFKCPLCEYRCTQNSALKKHLKTHSKTIDRRRKKDLLKVNEEKQTI